MTVHQIEAASLNKVINAILKLWGGPEDTEKVVNNDVSMSSGRF
jgi:hypothetical protein